MKSQNSLLSILFLTIVFSSMACEKDVYYVDYERQAEVQVIFDRGNIKHLGANLFKCYFTKEGSGLGVYDFNDSSFIFYTSINSQVGNVFEVQTVNDSTVYFAEDKTGLGYFRHGAYRHIVGSSNLGKFDYSGNFAYTRFNTIVYGAKPGGALTTGNIGFIAPTNVTAVAAHGNEAYVGVFEQGLFQFNPHWQKRQLTTEIASLTDNVIKDLTVSEPYLWILTNQGLTSKLKGLDSFSTYPLPGGVYGKNITTFKDHVFISTTNGIYWLVNGRIESFDQINNELPQVDNINVIKASPSGDLWIGTKKGLYRYKPVL